MKKLIVVIFLTSIIALGDQQAITDNKVEGTFGVSPRN